MRDRPVKRLCAVYTRKSSEEGLDQQFNSLNAQREACVAYIASQAGEGWKLVPHHYDDGGYSGGSMERPALAALLADIRAGKVDTVVVYKVDRLTRSLADFARIVEILDAHDVAFVSITQQFNTTTSMGRLTLNMLLSFAQFEREVTGERIRDKIAASKRKGMWMGGFVPLGYEPDGRTLTINEAEAETVRKVFALYLEHDQVGRVKAEADRLGLVTKRRASSTGRRSGGCALSRGYIYKLLNNPLYIGRIAHRGQVYEGLHPAIIDMETWEAVQARLASKAQGRRDGSANARTAPSPLAGRMVDEAGKPLTPSHANKNGRRYRYYVSRHLIDGSANHQRDGWRLPAREIERLVGDAVTGLLRYSAQLAGVLRAADIPADTLDELLAQATDWSGEPLALVAGVELGRERIRIQLDLEPLAGRELPTVEHIIATRIRRRGVEIRLVLDAPGAAAPAGVDPALVKAVARAHRWFDELAQGRAESILAIAEAEGVTPRYVGNRMALAFLAPDIVEAILDGRQPPELTAERLVRLTGLPLDWDRQRELLGFA